MGTETSAVEDAGQNTGNFQKIKIKVMPVPDADMKNAAENTLESAGQNQAPPATEVDPNTITRDKLIRDEIEARRDAIETAVKTGLKENQHGRVKVHFSGGCDDIFDDLAQDLQKTFPQVKGVGSEWSYPDNNLIIYLFNCPAGIAVRSELKSSAGQQKIAAAFQQAAQKKDSFVVLRTEGTYSDESWEIEKLLQKEHPEVVDVKTVNGGQKHVVFLQKKPGFWEKRRIMKQARKM